MGPMVGGYFSGWNRDWEGRYPTHSNSIIPTIFQLCNVDSAYTVSLYGINVDDEAFLAGLVGSD
jgi:hypothetical protein